MEKIKKPLSIQELIDYFREPSFIYTSDLRRIPTRVYINEFTKFYIRRLAKCMNIEPLYNECTYEGIYKIWLKYIMLHSTLVFDRFDIDILKIKGGIKLC